MPNELPSYYVIRCNNCNFCFGKHNKSKFSCPHCGEIQINPKILSRANNTEELHELVSINNMPEELRTEFEGLKKESKHIIETEDLIQIIPNLLLESANSKGLIYFEVLKKLLIKKNLSAKIGKIIEIAEVEGLLLRITDKKWQLLG
jgi:predicted RNA-binding Zn-ribbon protein involved in translation (DUF1610 family)